MSKKIILLPAAIIFALAACTPSSNSSSLTTTSDSEDPTTTTTTTSQSTTTTEEPPVTTTTSKPTPQNSFIIYFKDASWWNKDAAETAIYLYGEEGLENAVFPGEVMDQVDFIKTGTSPEGWDVGYNYKTYTIDLTKGYTHFVFVRSGLSGEVLSDWNARSQEIAIEDIPSDLTAPMYTIENTEAIWYNNNPENCVVGSWAEYDYTGN